MPVILSFHAKLGSLRLSSDVWRIEARYGSYLDAPWIGGLVEVVEDGDGGVLPVGQDLGQVLGAQHRPQRGRRQQLRAAARVLNVAHRSHRVLEGKLHCNNWVDFL